MVLCGRRRVGWRLQDLKSGGHRVSIVQNPTISLQDDAAVTKRVLAEQDGRRSSSATPMAEP